MRLMPNLRFCFIIFLLSMVFNLSGQPVVCMQSAFQPSFNAGSYPTSGGVADFNNDGILDIVTLHTAANSIVIHKGNGNGTFIAGGTYYCNYPRALTCGDFNGDAKQDIAFVEPQRLVILQGNGNFSFTQAQTLNFGSYLFAIARADFNSDNSLDLAVVDTYLKKVHVLHGNGAGSFATVAVCNTDSVPYDVTIGDFNNDGYNDIATANYGDGANGLTVMMATGNGSFTSSNIPVGFTVFSITSGDYNADGKHDVAIAGFNWLKVMLSTSTTFVPAGTYSLNSFNINMVSADFNLDGKSDIGCSCYGGKNVMFLQGQGSGSFNAPIIYNADLGPHDILAGDFNNDSKTDVAVINYNAHNVSVFLNDIPVLTVSGPNSLCAGQTATLIASGATTYTWNTLTTTASLSIAPPSSATYSVNASSVNGCTNSAQFTVTVMNCTSVSEVERAVTSLFPNPAIGYFCISGISRSAKVTLFDVEGSQIPDVHFLNGCYDIASVKTGMYFVKIEDQGSIYFRKLTIISP